MMKLRKKSQYKKPRKEYDSEGYYDDNEDMGNKDFDDFGDLDNSDNKDIDDDFDDYYKENGVDDDLNLDSGVMPMEKHNDLLKQLTDFAPFFKDIVNSWLGLVWSNQEKKYVKDPNIQAIMNIHCASWCVDFLRTYARKNNILTNISKKDYDEIQEDMIYVVWPNIGTRADMDFGITNDGDIMKICNQLEHSAKLVLMGAGDGKYNDVLVGTMRSNYSESGNNQNNNEQKKKGFINNVMSSLNNFGKS